MRGMDTSSVVFVVVVVMVLTSTRMTMMGHCWSQSRTCSCSNQRGIRSRRGGWQCRWGLLQVLVVATVVVNMPMLRNARGQRCWATLFTPLTVFSTATTSIVVVVVAVASTACTLAATSPFFSRATDCSSGGACRRSTVGGCDHGRTPTTFGRGRRRRLLVMQGLLLVLSLGRGGRNGS